MPRAEFYKWLADGISSLQIAEKNHSAIFIQLPKTARINYLFCETGWRNAGICMDDRFTFCGLYDRDTGTLHLADGCLRTLVDGLTPEECMDRKALLEVFAAQVNRRVEERVANDRGNLSVQTLQSERRRNDLAYYREYGAEEEAIRLFFGDSEPDFRFHSDYRLERWKEDGLLDYVQNPEAAVEAEAERYLAEHQEEILQIFLENDALQTAYEALLADTGSPVHRMRAITEAVKRSGAKTVTVTVQKDGAELTCQRRFEIVRKRRRNFVIFRREGR